MEQRRQVTQSTQPPSEGKSHLSQAHAACYRGAVINSYGSQRPCGSAPGLCGHASKARSPPREPLMNNQQGSMAQMAREQCQREANFDPRSHAAMNQLLSTELYSDRTGSPGGRPSANASEVSQGRKGCPSVPQPLSPCAPYVPVAP